MTEATPPVETVEEVKVVSMFDRQPYVPPDAPETIEERNKASADLLREVAEHIENGDIQGFLFLGWHDKAKTFQMVHEFVKSETISEEAYRFIGGLKEAESIVLEFAIHGTDAFEDMDYDE